MEIKLNSPEDLLREVDCFSIERFRENIRKWLHIEDSEILDTVLACMIAEKVGGDPLWLFLIAPPGGSKTEILRSFTHPEYFHHISDMTSKTLVSGLMIQEDKTESKEGNSSRRKIKDLLPQINGKTLIFKDFTTILEKSRDERREIIAQFRECYDGTFSKKFGTIDETITYKSRFGLVAGVTPVIDKHWKIMQQLGERFLKVRMTEDAEAITKRASENEGFETPMRKELEKNSNEFIAKLNLTRIPSFNEELFGDFICKIAKFIAYARTPISFNDNSDSFYFEYIATPEIPTRLVKQLKKLSKCLALIRGKEQVSQEEINTLLRVAKDTIPQDRRVILEAISRNQNKTINGSTRNMIFSEISISETTTRRILDQLNTLNLVIEQKVVDETLGYEQEIYFYKASSIWGDIFGTPLPEKSGVTE